MQADIVLPACTCTCAHKIPCVDLEIFGNRIGNFFGNLHAFFSSFFSLVDVDGEFFLGLRMQNVESHEQKLVRDFLSGKTSLTPLYRVLGLPERDVSDHWARALAVPGNIHTEEEVLVRHQTPPRGPRGNLPGLSERASVLYENGNPGEFPCGNWNFPEGRDERDDVKSTEKVFRSRSPRGKPKCVEEFPNTSIDKSFYNPAQTTRHFVPAVDRCNRCGEVKNCWNDQCLCRCGKVILVGPESNLVRWLPRSRARNSRRVSWNTERVPTTAPYGSQSNDGASKGWNDSVESSSSNPDFESDLRSDVPTSRCIDYGCN